MTFLPIVERELRVASRRRGTYWTRFFIALAALFLFVIIASESSALPSSFVARETFYSLSGLMLVVCLCSGVFTTADCLSSEKRQGTAGLLFLTDLRGYDVVLGKLAAHSLHSFYGLLSMLPILALPLLMGGITPAEFWRMVIVLTSSMLLSLGVGMFVSSALRESRQAFLLTLVLLIAVTLLLPLCASLANARVRTGPAASWMFWPSPIFAFRSAVANIYTFGGGAADFRHSIATILVLALACLGIASLILPRTWQERSVAGSSKKIGFWGRLRFGSGEGRLARRRRLQDINPVLWLTSRDRLARVLCWGALLPGVALWLWVAFKASTTSGFNYYGFVMTMMYISFILNLLFKFVVASEASRRLNEDRQTGALELLLVTPATVPSILAGQRRALVRHFAIPLLVCLGLICGTFWYFANAGSSRTLGDGGILKTVLVGNMFALVSDFLAICWVGMWDGLRARQHHRAILRTLIKILVCPWFIFILMMTLLRGARNSGDAQAVFILWFILGIVNNLVWMARARSGLLRFFRSLVAEVATGAARRFFIVRGSASAS